MLLNRLSSVNWPKEGIKPVAQVARDLGISESGLPRWMAQADGGEGIGLAIPQNPGVGTFSFVQTRTRRQLLTVFVPADRVDDTEIGGVRKSKGGIGGGSPTTSYCGGSSGCSICEDMGGLPVGATRFGLWLVVHFVSLSILVRTPAVLFLWTSFVAARRRDLRS